MLDPSKIDEEHIRKREQDLAGHSEQIGRLCTLWSGLELDVACFLISVSHLEDPTDKNVLVGMLDMRAKISALIAIAHKRKPSEEWFKNLSIVLNKIDSQLRDERNRIIHDYWLSIPSEDGREIMNRVRIRPKVKNEPKSGISRLHLATFKPTTPEDILNLCEDVIAANVKMNLLRREFDLFPLHGKPPKQY